MENNNIEKAKIELKEFRKGYGQSQLNDDCIIQLMLLHSSFRNQEIKAQTNELFGLIESIHHLFESDKPITKDSHIGRSIEVAYKTFKD